MEAFRKTNLALILWCLIVAGSYAFDLLRVYDAMGREEMGFLDLDWYGLIFYGLSGVLITGALLSIFTVKFLWVVVAAVVLKALMQLPVATELGVNIWQVFFRTAFVGGLSYMFIHWARQMGAYRQEQALPEEF